MPLTPTPLAADYLGLTDTFDITGVTVPGGTQLVVLDILFIPASTPVEILPTITGLGATWERQDTGTQEYEQIKRYRCEITGGASGDITVDWSSIPGGDAEVLYSLKAASGHVSGANGATAFVQTGRSAGNEVALDPFAEPENEALGVFFSLFFPAPTPTATAPLTQLGSSFGGDPDTLWVGAGGIGPENTGVDTYGFTWTGSFAYRALCSEIAVASAPPATDVDIDSFPTEERAFSVTLTPGAVSVAPLVFPTEERAFGVTLQQSVSVLLAEYATEERAFQVVVSPGPVVVSPGAFVTEERAFAVSIGVGAVTVSPAGFPTEERAFPLAVSMGAIAVSLGSFPTEERAFDVSAFAGLLVSLGAFSSEERAFAPSVSVGPVSVSLGAFATEERALTVALQQVIAVALQGFPTEERAFAVSASTALVIALSSFATEERAFNVTAQMGAIAVALSSFATEERGFVVILSGANDTILSSFPSEERVFGLGLTIIRRVPLPEGGEVDVALVRRRGSVEVEDE